MRFNLEPPEAARPRLEPAVDTLQDADGDLVL